jgi:hypothetical protein
VALTALAFAIAVVPRVHAASVVAEAESRHPSSTNIGEVMSDSTASGGRVRMLWSNGSMSGTLSLPSTDRFVVRARGTQCAGAPQMAVDVDGSRVLTANVASTTHADYAATLNLRSGSHTVRIAFLNNYKSPTCDRNLLVDKVTFDEPPSTDPAPPPPPPQMSVWRADMEEGNLAEWTGEFNQSAADSVASQYRAHTGLWSAKQTTDTSSGGAIGTRLARHTEIRQTAYRDAIYGFWVYFPQRITIPSNGFYLLAQFKASVCQACGGDITWGLYIRTRADGQMVFRLTDKTGRHLVPGWAEPGTRYDQDAVTIPTGQWVNVQIRYRSATTNTGQVTVWQNGQQLWDFPNRRTTWNCSDCTDTQVPGAPAFMVNAYGQSLSPATVTQYVDDATIRVP